MRILVFGWLLGILAACSNPVKLEPGGSGAGGAASSSATAGDGGGTPVACGGRGGPTCDATEYCDHPGDTCGADDGEGQCTARPEGCRDDCPGVCGCDGRFYCNECSAHQAGVDVSEDTACMEPQGVTYVTLYMPGQDHAPDVLWVHRTDTGADQCVILVLYKRDERTGVYDVTLPEGWAVWTAEITDNAEDCAIDPPPPGIEPSEDPTDVTGSLQWEIAPGNAAPCTLDVDVTITFPEEYGTIEMRATGVAVHNPYSRHECP
ncbi:hypothetical protein [Sorangium sp. So ce388]|uniref:hypothetical protein n=1 Tax=Sorangium sp. So ce388 TaxID=3133309 RepID=UPI003F5B9F15